MATTEHSLTKANWTEIGSGPLLIETIGTRNALLHFADVAPPIDTDACHVLSGTGAFSYGGALKCFARSIDETSKVVTTEGV